ncbi:outer membrane beta-barrel protein [Photobacterium kagoshimensis]|uniref:outer membrane beta-barrel protein n=1 Tax=Photobacterium kagoshimensis TaxID=2910242 RepID=UPI003D1113EB
MKKVLSVAAVALALSATAVQANEGVYVGANYQFNKITATELNDVFKNDTNTLNFIAGYDFNEFFAVEGNIGLGMSSNSEPFDTGTFKESISGKNQDVRFKGKIGNKQGMSYGIHAVGKLPVHEMFGLFAKVGYSSMSYETNISAKETFSDTNLGKGTEKTNIGGLSYAIGAEFNVMPELAITAEYGAFGESKEVLPKTKFKASGFNIGMKYKF